MPSSLHSSRSSHSWLSKLRACPSGHSQVNEPTVFTHLPPWHRPGIASHSSTSVDTETMQFIHLCSPFTQKKQVLCMNAVHESLRKITVIYFSKNISWLIVMDGGLTKCINALWLSMLYPMPCSSTDCSYRMLSLTEGTTVWLELMEFFTLFGSAWRLSFVTNSVKYMTKKWHSSTQLKTVTCHTIAYNMPR